MSASIEKYFLSKLGDKWKTATPGFRLQAYREGKKIADLAIGETWDVYDWASLTKIVFTISRFMFLEEEGRAMRGDPVASWLDWFPEDRPATLGHLMSHSAGMTWWYPFYKDIEKHAPEKATPEEAWRSFEGILRRRVTADLRQSAFDPEVKSVYSDLDFFLLGFILEEVTGRTLWQNWQEHADRLGLSEANFSRGNKPKIARKLYAPTEIDREWRNKTLQGEVHDQNTWALRGVAPHAGLFGPIEELSKFGLHLRGAIQGKKSKKFPSPGVVRSFTKRAITRERGDWAYGFMMPTKGSASCGPKFSLSSVGHTGFTGTSLWYDPKKDLLINLLSNRVHPSANNKEFQTLRPLLHTWIAEQL